MRYTGWHLWMTRLTKTPRAWRSNYSFKLLLGTVQPVEGGTGNLEHVRCRNSRRSNHLGFSVPGGDDLGKRVPPYPHGLFQVRRFALLTPQALSDDVQRASLLLGLGDGDPDVLCGAGVAVEELLEQRGEVSKTFDLVAHDPQDMGDSNPGHLVDPSLLLGKLLSHGQKPVKGC